MKSKILTILALALCAYLPAYAGKKKKPPAPKPKPQTESCELCKVLARYGHNPEGLLPLHYAILQKDFKAVDLLLKNGASPLTIDKDVYNCVYYAIKSGSVPMVKKFISLGANVKDVRGRASDAFYVAVYEKKLEVAKYLITSRSLPQEILNKSFAEVAYQAYSITFEQSTELLRLLVKYGADIHSFNTPQRSLIDYVIFRGGAQGVEMAEFLKSLGAK